MNEDELLIAKTKPIPTTLTAKVFEDGRGSIIIPWNIVELLEINNGDKLEITFRKVYKLNREDKEENVEENGEDDYDDET